MTGIRIQYIRLEIRKWLIYMRRRFLGLSLALLLSGAALYCLYLRIADNGEKAIVQVALVIPEDQEELKFIANLLKYLDSVRNTAAFVYPDEAEVDSLFESGDIQAAIFFGEDFYEDVNTGVNTPLSIRLAPAFQGMDLFQELLSDIAAAVDVVEAASYAMLEAYEKYPALMARDEMETLIMEDNVQLLMEIRDQVSIKILSMTGEMELLPYYITLGFLFFLLICGFGFWSLYDPRQFLVEEKLRLYGIGRIYRSGCKIILMTAAGFIYALLGLGICSFLSRYPGFSAIGHDFRTVMGLLVFSAALSCFFHGILSAGSGNGERKIILFLVLLIFLILGGCIVPTACMPGALQAFAGWTPFFLYQNYLGAVLFGGNISYTGIVAWSAAFLLLGEGIYTALSRSRTDAYSFWNTRKHIKRAMYQGGLKARLLKAGYCLKWQLFRKTPAVTAACFLLLLLLAGSIRFPQWADRTISISGEEELCRKLEKDSLLNQAFRFVYKADEKAGKEDARGARVLASADFLEKETVLYTAALSPEALVAKETLAAARYRYSQEILLAKECEAVFGDAALAKEVSDTFEQYIQSEKLFHIVYQMEGK